MCVTLGECVWQFGVTHVYDTFLAATDAFVDIKVDGHTVEWLACVCVRM